MKGLGEQERRLIGYDYKDGTFSFLLQTFSECGGIRQMVELLIQVYARYVILSEFVQGVSCGLLVDLGQKPGTLSQSSCSTPPASSISQGDGITHS